VKDASPGRARRGTNKDAVLRGRELQYLLLLLLLKLLHVQCVHQLLRLKQVGRAGVAAVARQQSWWPGHGEGISGGGGGGGLGAGAVARRAGPARPPPPGAPARWHGAHTQSEMACEQDGELQADPRQKQE
jgi:hypothetical protein